MLVTSVAAFEHFLDVPQVLKETHRVRLGAAVSYGPWSHLFTSPSGGHNVSLSEVPLLHHSDAGLTLGIIYASDACHFTCRLNEWRTRAISCRSLGEHFEIVEH